MNKKEQFSSNDNLTILLKKSGINTWNELTDFIKELPYGRNSNRTDLSLVIKERKGSCSSKHALLKRIADLNSVQDCKLILGIYKMNHSNTPNIGNEIVKNGLDYIPEAHCYISKNGERIDYTSNQSNFKELKNDIIEEIEIDPEQVAEFKIEYHKRFLRKWLIETNSNLTFEEVWKIRERCIENLSQKSQRTTTVNRQ